MIKAIIVDDEPAARRNMELILTEYCGDDIELAGQAGSVKEAWQLINRYHPNLVFLDIEMGFGTGFDLVAMFPQPDFHVVFVTAFDQYAIRAIKISALDYLTKPVSISEVKEAVSKAKQRIEMGFTPNVQNLMDAVLKKGDLDNIVAIPIMGGYKMLKARDILYLEAHKEYTYIFSREADKICSSHNLGYYEDLLADYPFFRVHHSYIVGRLHIREFNRTDGGEVVLENGHSLPVSRRRKTGFVEWLRV